MAASIRLASLPWIPGHRSGPPVFRVRPGNRAGTPAHVTHILVHMAGPSGLGRKRREVMNVSADEYPVPSPVIGRGAVFVEHRLKSPQVSESAYIAPTAVLAGDVTVGPHSRVLFGAVITAEGGSVQIGSNCVVMENTV